MNFPWTCPYCSRDATITDSNISTSQHSFHQNNKVGRLLLQTHAIVCPTIGVATSRLRQPSTARFRVLDRTLHGKPKVERWVRGR